VLLVPVVVLPLQVLSGGVKQLVDFFADSDDEDETLPAGEEHRSWSHKRAGLARSPRWSFKAYRRGYATSNHRAWRLH
jgi:hypothetical protein